MSTGAGKPPGCIVFRPRIDVGKLRGLEGLLQEEVDDVLRAEALRRTVEPDSRWPREA